MAAPQQLHFQLEEPGEDPFCDQIFATLCGVLQPESEISVETAIAQITMLLPEKQPYCGEVYLMLCTCFEIAEQIPHDHPSMLKLVTLIDLCLRSSRLSPRDGSNSVGPTQKLGEATRDWWDSTFPENGLTKYVNFQAFVAYVYERNLIRGRLLPVYTLNSAFDEGAGDTPETRNAYVEAALHYILITGDAIGRAITEDKDTIYFNNWDHWYKQVSAVASKRTDNKGWTYGPYIVELASQAKIAMDAIERKRPEVRPMRSNSRCTSM